MDKYSKRSVERLYHFQCIHCHKWWTIGDAPEDKEEWWCPWCGKSGIFKENNGFDGIKKPNEE